VEKVALQEILRYLTLFQDVFKTQRLFAVEPAVEELPQTVLEIVRQGNRSYVQATVKQYKLPLVGVLETIFRVLVPCRLITITATLLLHLLPQLFLVRLLWVLAAVQGLPLAQDLTVIPAVRVAA
jgi:hypothetical protein